MAIDPSDYDVVGLRELALGRERRPGDGPADPGTGGTRPLEDLAEADRQVQWLGSHDERHKPYLRRIPARSDLHDVLRGWLDRLVDRAGTGGAAEAVDHYERLGWITESVGAELRGALPETDGRAEGSVEDLTRIDHVHGLSVVALAGLGADGEQLAAEGSTRPTDGGSESRPSRRTGREPGGRSPRLVGREGGDRSGGTGGAPEGSEG